MTSGVYERTKENIKNLSKAQIERYKDPKEREKTSLVQIKRFSDPKEREKHSRSQQNKRKIEKIT